MCCNSSAGCLNMRARVAMVPIGRLLKEVVGGRQTEQFECSTAELLLEFVADPRKLFRVSCEKYEYVKRHAKCVGKTLHGSHGCVALIVFDHAQVRHRDTCTLRELLECPTLAGATKLYGATDIHHLTSDLIICKSSLSVSC